MTTKRLPNRMEINDAPLRTSLPELTAEEAARAMVAVVRRVAELEHERWAAWPWPSKHKSNAVSDEEIAQEQSEG